MIHQAPSERIAKCLAHAEECRVTADLTQHPALKTAFVDAAEAWEILAREIDSIDKMGKFVMERSRQ